MVRRSRSIVERVQPDFETVHFGLQEKLQQQASLLLAAGNAIDVESACRSDSQQCREPGEAEMAYQER